MSGVPERGALNDYCCCFLRLFPYREGMKHSHVRTWLACALVSFSAVSSVTGLSDEVFWQGPARVLVIPLEWGNKPAQVSMEELQRTFFGQEPGDRSLAQFYSENSAGRHTITGDVLPWVKTKHKWSRLWCMFQEKVTEWFDHRHGCSPNTITRIAWDLVKDRVRIADYDADGDGKIDQLIVVHSGRMYKQRGTPDDTFNYRFKQAKEAIVFQSQGIGRTGSLIPIGFYLHEAGHNLFLLGDYYGDGTNAYMQGRYGLGMWGIMGLGAWGYSNSMELSELFRYPTHFEAASKVRIGWANAQVFTRSFAHVRLRPVETSADVAIVPFGANQFSSLYFEYRSGHGLSAHHPGRGLLAWRGWELQQADGRDDLNHGNKLGKRPLPPNHENFGDASDPYPGELGVTSFTEPKSQIRISGIVQTPEAVEFDIEFPDADHEQQSQRALVGSLKTLNPAFRPVSLNGLPWDQVGMSLDFSRGARDAGADLRWDARGGL